MEFGGGAVSPSLPARGSGERCKLPAESGAELRPAKGFLHYVPPDCLSHLVLTYWYILVAMCVTEGGEEQIHGLSPLTVSWVHVPCDPLLASDAYVTSLNLSEDTVQQDQLSPASLWG